MNRRIAVRGIIVDDDGRLFCVRLKAYGGTAERTFWCVPGGGLDPGEPLVMGVKRELLEETGVHADVGQLLFIQQYGSVAKEELEFFFLVKNWKDFVDIDISSATHADEEIAEFGFVDPKHVQVLPRFLAEVNLTDLSSPAVSIFNYLQ